jgi:hypothetical protein
VKCSEFLHELTDYLDGVMDSPTKAELEEHLAWCHNCYVVCDTTKKTIEIYRDSQLYELPENLRTRLRSAIVQKCQSRKKAGPENAAFFTYADRSKARSSTYRVQLLSSSTSVTYTLGGVSRITRSSLCRTLWAKMESK